MRSRRRGNPTLRMLDRAIGPLILRAGGLRPKRPAPEQPCRIGFLDGTAIGDTVLISAVARDVAAAYPDAAATMFVGRAALPFARRLEGVRAVPIELTRPRAAIAQIRRERLDVLLDFGSWPRIEAIYALLSGARFTAGFRTRGQRRHFGFDRWVDYSPRLHALENFRELARIIGVEAASPPRLDPPGRVLDKDLPPAPYAVFHLWPAGIRSELKEWPAGCWRALAESLVEQGLTIVLTGAAEDELRAREFLAGSPASLRGRLLDATGKYDLDELLDVLSRSRCVVSVNTGVMHLAAAVGAPTVALNGPTSEQRWGPVGERAISVNSSLPGCGYLYLGWEYDGRRSDCMEGISVQRVLDALTEVTRNP